MTSPSNSRQSSTLTSGDWDERDARVDDDDLAGPSRTPIEDAFYESYIIQSRTAIDNLYASNVLSCQKHTKELADLARQRRVKLSYFEREQRRLVKRMNEITLKQGTMERKYRKKTKTRRKKIESLKPELTGKSAPEKERIPEIHTQGDKTPDVNTKELRTPSPGVLMSQTADNISKDNAGSLPPLTRTEKLQAADKNASKKSEYAVTEMGGKTLSMSCNDLTTLCDEYRAVLPTISGTNERAQSHETITRKARETRPFVTSRGAKSLASRETMIGRVRPRSWNESQFYTVTSTKVKWVPRS